MTRLPCSDSSSIRSTISFTTMAVLLMASAPDNASAVCQVMLQMVGTRKASPMVASVAPVMVAVT